LRIAWRWRARGRGNLEALPHPVFFYEAAATRPDRVNLENVRRGQFEGMREEMKKNHERQPDVGERSCIRRRA